MEENKGHYCYGCKQYFHDSNPEVDTHTGCKAQKLGICVDKREFVIKDENIVKNPVWSGTKYKREGGKHVMIEDVSREMKLTKIKNALGINEEEAMEILTDIDSGKEMIFSDHQLHQLMVFGLRFDSKDKSEWRARRLAQEKEIELNRQRQQEMLKKAEVWIATLTEEQREMVMAYGYEHCKMIACG